MNVIILLNSVMDDGANTCVQAGWNHFWQIIDLDYYFFFQYPLIIQNGDNGP